jgi:hypothetical protein
VAGVNQDGFRYTLAEEIPGVVDQFRAVFGDALLLSGHDRGAWVVTPFLPLAD